MRKSFDANMHYNMAWTGTGRHESYNTVPGLVLVKSGSVYKYRIIVSARARS